MIQIQTTTLVRRHLVLQSLPSTPADTAKSGVHRIVKYQKSKTTHKVPTIIFHNKYTYGDSSNITFTSACVHACAYI
jgi:hypothetical protein